MSSILLTYRVVSYVLLDCILCVQFENIGKVIMHGKSRGGLTDQIVSSLPIIYNKVSNGS